MSADDELMNQLRALDGAPFVALTDEQQTRADARKTSILATDPNVATSREVKTKRGRALPLTITGILAACGIVVGGTVIAVAGDDRDRAEPALTVAEDSFHPADDVDAAWAAAVEGYPAPLPQGIEFPHLAPAFFHPTDLAPGDNPVFAEGLIDGIATAYWKCAWLDEKIDSERAGDAAAADAADRALEETYPLLPGSVHDQPNQAEIDQDLATEAAALGTTVAEVEFSRDCAVYEEEQP